MSKRAIRRHHYQRLKRKRYQWWDICRAPAPWISAELRPELCRYQWWDGDIDNETAAFLVNTPTPCSCFACGNPRRHFGEKTRQEIAYAP